MSERALEGPSPEPQERWSSKAGRTPPSAEDTPRSTEEGPSTAEAVAPGNEEGPSTTDVAVPHTEESPSTVVAPGNEESPPTAKRIPASAEPASTPPEHQKKRREKRKAKDKDKDKKKKKAEKHGLGTIRGIETMFRTLYQTHNSLTDLADSKANIMISINGLIISILIASIGAQLTHTRWLLLPTSVLLLGCLISTVCAVLAARPRVSRHLVTLESVRSGKSNILFFGNFVRMGEDEFVEGMQELMKNTDRVYLNMIRDLYSLGGILDRKFRLLRVAYTVFMVGLVAGVLMLILTYAVVGVQAPF